MGTDTGGFAATIKAPAQRIIDTLLDFDAYPQWQKIMSDSRVLDRDADGRPELVEFVVDVKVRAVRYVSRYRYDLPGSFAWDLERGDLRRNSGEYRFAPRSEGITDVTVSISFDPGFYVPGPVRNVIQAQSLRTTMRELRARVGG